MSDGIEVGRAFVSIASDVDAAGLARQGREVGLAFSRAFTSTAAVGLSTVEAGLSSVTRGFSKAASAASGTFSTLSTTAGIARNAVDGIYTGITRLTGAAGMIVGTLPTALSMASSAVGSLGNAIDAASAKAEHLGATLTAAITLPVVGAATAITKFGIQMAMSLENATVAFTALLPPGYDVLNLVNQLQALAIASPAFAVDELFDFTKKLVGAGVAGADVMPTLNALNKIFITYGVTGDQAAEVLLGVSQVFQKGKVQSEELTRQISQQIPIWHLLSEASGQTQAQLLASSKAGTFTADAFQQMLVQIGQLPEITRGAATGVTTLSSQLTIAKEAFQQAIATKFLEFFPEIKDQLTRLQPILVDFTGFVLERIPQLVDLFVKFTDEVVKLRSAFFDLDPATQNIIKRIAYISPAVGPALLALGALGSGVGGLLKIVSFALNPWIALTAGFALGANYLWQTSQVFRDSVLAFANSFVAAWKEAMPNAMANFRSAVESQLLPALAKLAAAFGFVSWEKFGAWLGTELPNLMAKAVLTVASAISSLASLVSFFSKEWAGLDEQTKKTILHFAAFLPIIVPLLPALSMMLGLFGAITSAMAFFTSTQGLMLLGMVALGFEIKHLWDTSERFHTAILNLQAGLIKGWGQYMPAALHGFVQALESNLIPAVHNLAAALGIPTIGNFTYWLGTAIPHVMALAVNAVTSGVKLISEGLNKLAGFWRGLDKQTQEFVLHLAKVALEFSPLLLVLPLVLTALGGLFGVLGAIGGLLFGVVRAAFGVLFGVVGAAFGVVRSLLGVTGELAGGILGLATVARVAATGGILLLGYGLYELWQRSETLRESVLLFASAFKTSWGQQVPGAAATLVATIRGSLLPALRDLAYAFGFPTLQSFAVWLGTVLPVLIADVVSFVSTVIGVISGWIERFAVVWYNLDENTKNAVESTLAWAVAAAVLIPLITGLATAIFGLMSPWQWVLVGAVAAFKFFDEHSQTFRETVDAFVNSFKASWGTELPGILLNLQGALGALVAPLRDMFTAAGFDTWQQFGAWLGAELPRLLGEGATKIHELAIEVGGWITELKGIWDNLSDSTKHAIEKVAELGVLLAPFSGLLSGIAGTALSAGGNLAMMAATNPEIALAGVAVLGLSAAIFEGYNHSKDFKDGVDGFIKSFKEGWAQYVTPAWDHFVAVIQQQFLPAMEGLLRSFGFNSWKEFGDWLGTAFAQNMAQTVQDFANLFTVISGVITVLTPMIDDLKKLVDLIDRIPGVDIGGYAKDAAIGPFGQLSELLSQIKGAFATGGLIGGTGTGTSDSNLIWASKGEYMMPESAVSQWGVGAMDSIANGNAIPVTPAGPTNIGAAGSRDMYADITVVLDGEVVGKKTQVLIDRNNRQMTLSLRGGRV